MPSERKAAVARLRRVSSLRSSATFCTKAQLKSSTNRRSSRHWSVTFRLAHGRHRSFASGSGVGTASPTILATVARGGCWLKRLDGASVGGMEESGHVSHGRTRNWWLRRWRGVDGGRSSREDGVGEYCGKGGNGRRRAAQAAMVSSAPQASRHWRPGRIVNRSSAAEPFGRGLAPLPGAGVMVAADARDVTAAYAGSQLSALHRLQTASAAAGSASPLRVSPVDTVTVCCAM